MSFTADKQTLDDLNLLGKYKSDSIFSLFNQVHTTGGEKLLAAMFRNPLSDADKTNERSHIFRFFQSRTLAFPFRQEQIDTMEGYLGDDGNGSWLVTASNTLKKQLLEAVIKDERYGMMLNGIKATIRILSALRVFIGGIDSSDATTSFKEQLQQVKSILNDERLDGLLKTTAGERLSSFDVIRFDHLLHNRFKKEMDVLMEFIYLLDVYITVSNVAALKGFTYANALPKQNNLVNVVGLYHPRLEKAVTNPMSLHQGRNVIFLTGSNMAGKSTLMKTLGIAIYLAHMGFPVAAKEMTFSVKDGLYSSINVPDNLSMGYSHFYAEVLRVKQVAEEVSRSKDLIVIFDELFKGTNVKDAYDATLSVTEAFAEYRNCFFIISTHIIEVGEALKSRCNNLQFSYLPTVMDGNVPRYTYQLSEGITTDRQGMVIIENEGILEILKA
jgi:DNA mismatch repair protein MutS